MVVMPSQEFAGSAGVHGRHGTDAVERDVDDVPDVVDDHAALALALGGAQRQHDDYGHRREFGARHRERTRRSRIGMMAPRRLSTPSMSPATGECGSPATSREFPLRAGCRRRRSRGPAKRSGPDASHRSLPPPLAWFHCCASTTRASHECPAISGSHGFAIGGGGVGHRGSASHFVICAPGMPCHKP